MFLRKRLTFGWCQMIDGSQLTRCCRITVVWVDPVTMTLLWRWSCSSSDVTSVVDQRLQAWCCRYSCRFSGDAPQCNYLHFFDYLSTAVEFWLTPWWSLIVNLSHSGDHWLSPVQNISFSSFVLSGRLTHLASDWLAVSVDDNPSINVYEMRFSRGEINDYYSIYTMTTSPYLYITTIYSYWRTLPWLNKLYNIQLQYFRAKLFYKVQYFTYCFTKCLQVSEDRITRSEKSSPIVANESVRMTLLSLQCNRSFIFLQHDATVVAIIAEIISATIAGTTVLINQLPQCNGLHAE